MPRVNEFGGERMSDKPKMSKYIKKNTPKIKLSMGNMTGKKVKVKRVEDTEPNYKIKMPKFPKGLV